MMSDPSILIYSGLRRSRRLVVCATLGWSLLASSFACADARSAKIKVKPWIDLTDAFCFPLNGGGRLATSEQLAQSMESGYRKRMALPDTTDVVAVDGPGFPVIDDIAIELSDALVDPRAKDERLRTPRKVRQTLAAGHLKMRADGVRIEESRIDMGLVARHLRLDLGRDKHGQAVAKMTEAREARVTFDVSRADLDALLLAAAREGGSKRGLYVRRTTLKLEVLRSRTISVDLKIDVLVGFIPAGLRFIARIDVDDQLNATMTRLSCTGDQILGPLLSGFIAPALRKYEGKTRRVAGFPTGPMMLQDFTLLADDRVRLSATFGRGIVARRPPGEPRPSR